MRYFALCVTTLFSLSSIAFADDTTAPTSEPPMAAGPAPTGSVTRAQFTSAVQDREPTDNLSSLTNDKTRVFFYTEIKGMAGHKVTHRWEYKNKTMYEQSFDVGSARWRVWSSKTFDPLWTGDWNVSVVDENGVMLGSQTLNYTEAPAAPASKQ